MNKTATLSANPHAPCGPSVVAPISSSRTPSFATMSTHRRPATSSAVVIAIAWFDHQQLVLLHDVAGDPAKLEDTFEEWEANARRALADLKSQGVAAEPFDVRMADLVRW